MVLKNKKCNLSSRKSNKKRIFILVAVLLIALSAGGAYALYNNKNDQGAEEKTAELITADKNRVDTPKVSPPPTEQPVKQNSTKYVPDEDKDKVFKYELLTENEEFKIRKRNNDYYVTLYAIINRPDQSDMYRDQLAQYKKSALKYLDDNNVNVNAVKIHYEPSEASEL